MYHTADAGAAWTKVDVTSGDAGKTWQRYNDDKHQHGGISTLAASHIIPGRLVISGAGAACCSATGRQAPALRTSRFLFSGALGAPTTWTKA